MVVEQLVAATPEQFQALENAMMDVETESTTGLASDAPRLWDKVFRVAKDKDKGNT